MRLFRALLFVYPGPFRREYGDDLAAAFAARRADAAGVLGVTALWLDTIADTAINAAALHWDWLLQDVRLSLRGWSRARGFAITAILLSALGIGVTTATFSVADHVLVRPLPFPDPDSLVRLWQDQTFRGYPMMEQSPANFLDWQRMARSFSGMAAYTGRTVNLGGVGDPERIDDAWVTVNLFTVLGVPPALGRALGDADAPASAPAVVVLSDRFWRTRFAADPTVIGRTVLLDETPHTVVGVMTPAFEFPSRDIDTWTPLRLPPELMQDRTDTYLDVVARIHPGVTLAEARSDMAVVAAQLAQSYPKENGQTGATVFRLRDRVSSTTRTLLLTLVAAAACLLLIVCLNLANLLVARALTRERELAVRAALGAGGGRIVRQMLTESVALALLGGGLGVLVATMATPLIARLVPTTLPIAAVPAPDTRMLFVALAVTLVTGIAFGVLPAWRVGRTLDVNVLRSGGRAGTGTATSRIRSGLVVAEVALSVVLLIASALLIRAMWRVQGVDPGFVSEDLLTLRTTLPMPRYAVTAARQRFYDDVVRGIEGLPGVTRAAYISYLPMVMGGGIWPLTLNFATLTPEARRSWAPDPNETRTASLRYVTPGFFDALGIPLVRGRDVSAADTHDRLRVAVVSESLVRERWPDREPIGQQFFIAFDVRTVVGVVRDIRVRGLEQESEPQVYIPSAQVADGDLTFYAPKDLVVKSSLPPATLLPAVRAVIARADATLPIADVQTLGAIVESQTASRRAQLRVLGALAAAAFLLAGVGLYGVLAFMVSSQTRELGVRLALGAKTSTVAAMVVRRGLALAAVGITLGLALAFGVGSYLRSILTGVTPQDPAAFGTAAGLVLLLTLLGSLLPALRAARIDPLAAIRME